MPHNPYKSCQGCPARSLTCRATCDGWQAREQEKALRYEMRRNRIGAQVMSREYLLRVDKARKLKMRGQMCK